MEIIWLALRSERRCTFTPGGGISCTALGMETFTTPHPCSWPMLSGAGFEGFAVPVRPLLEAEAFGPDEVKVLVSAFEASLKALRLVDRKDPAVLMVAKRVIALAKAGNLDPLALRDEVVKTFKNNSPRKP